MIKQLTLGVVFSLGVLISTQGFTALVDSHQWIENSEEPEDSFSCIDDVTTTADGKWLYALATCDKTINIFSINEDNTLTLVDTLVSDDSDPQVPSNPADAIEVSPDGNHLYVYGSTLNTDQSPSGIFVFEIDSETGALEFEQFFSEYTGNDDSDTFLFSNDGLQLYVASASGDLAILSRGVNGQLANQIGYDLSAIFTDLASSGNINHIAIGPDEEYLYIAFSSGTLAVFTLNEVGEIGLNSIITDTGVGGVINSFVLAENGLDIYAVVSTNSLVQFRFTDDSKRAVDRSEVLNGENAIEGLLLSENNKLLYSMDTDDKSFQVWGRDESTGGLELLGTVQGGTQGFDSDQFEDVNNFELANDPGFAYASVLDGISVINLQAESALSAESSSARLDDNEPYIWQINVTNNGPATAHNLIVTIDTLGLTYTSVDVDGESSECTSNEDIITCNISDLEEEIVKIISVNFTAQEQGTIAVLSAELTQAQIDTNESNNEISLALSTKIDTFPDNPSNSAGGTLAGWLLVLMSALSLVRRKY